MFFANGAVEIVELTKLNSIKVSLEMLIGVNDN